MAHSPAQSKVAKLMRGDRQATRRSETKALKKAHHAKHAPFGGKGGKNFQKYWAGSAGESLARDRRRGNVRVIKAK